MHARAPMSANTQPNHSMPSVRPEFVMDVGESPAPPGPTPAVRPPSLAQYGTGGSSAFGSQMSYGSSYDDASYSATAPGVLGMSQAAPGAYLCGNQSVCRYAIEQAPRRWRGVDAKKRAVKF